MKTIILTLSIILLSFTSKATIHTVKVWAGYYAFLEQDITIQLGDTVQWLPLGVPSMTHTITSSNIPIGAAPFDKTWQAPADTFFQYIPQIVGLYEYVCTPHVALGMVGSINVIEPPTEIKGNELSDTKLLIYPNPTTDFIHFNELNSIYPYKIFTSNGKLVLSGTTNDIVNVSILTHGVYYIEIISDKRRIIKFIKLK